MFVSLVTTPGSYGRETLPADDNTMKICLAFAFEAQEAIHKETMDYAKTPEMLKIQDDKYCRDLVLSVPKANKKKFVVMAKSGQKIWTVDQSKTIRQVR